MIFGDAEPEDAWDAGDPTRVLLDNLGRRCSILGEARDLPVDATDRELLADITRRLHRLVDIRTRLSDRDRVRVDLIADDVDYLRDRLGMS